MKPGDLTDTIPAEVIGATMRADIEAALALSEVPMDRGDLLAVFGEVLPDCFVIENILVSTGRAGEQLDPCTKVTDTYAEFLSAVTAGDIRGVVEKVFAGHGDYFLELQDRYPALLGRPEQGQSLNTLVEKELVR